MSAIKGNGRWSVPSSPLVRIVEQAVEHVRCLIGIYPAEIPEHLRGEKGGLEVFIRCVGVRSQRMDERSRLLSGRCPCRAENLLRRGGDKR